MPYRYVGQTGSCVECRAAFPKTSPTKVRCSPCQALNRKRQAVEKLERHGAKYRATKASSRAKSLGTTVLSAPVPCCRCDTPFLRKSAFGQYCDACQRQGKWARIPEEKRDEIRAKRRARRRERHLSEPAFALNKRVSMGILHSLKTAKAGRSWEALVGYSLAELMAHLERQFPAGMSWSNRSDWHVDHIVPLASFEFSCPEDPEFQAAWALTNLRPLSASENVRKGDRRTHLI